MKMLLGLAISLGIIAVCYLIVVKMFKSTFQENATVIVGNAYIVSKSEEVVKNMFGKTKLMYDVVFEFETKKRIKLRLKKDVADQFQVLNKGKLRYKGHLFIQFDKYL